MTLDARVVQPSNRLTMTLDARVVHPKKGRFPRVLPFLTTRIKLVGPIREVLVSTVVVLISLSIVAQMVAALLSLRLIAITGRRLVWVVFFACILLMLINRVLALQDIAQGMHNASAVSLASAASMLAISLAMAVGTALIKPIFRNLFQAQEQLTRERNFAETLIQRAPTFFVAIDSNGNLIMMNKVMMQALGYREGEVEGKPYLETFVPPDDHAKVHSTFWKLTAGATPPMIQNRVVSKSGEQRLVEWYGSPVHNAQGEFEYFIGIGMDRTDIQVLEEQLKQAQKMEAIGRLAGGIAHDFNNILTTVQGHAEQLLARSENGDEVHDSSQRILDASRTAAEFTRQLLVFSRNQVTEAAVLNINEVLTKMEPLLDVTAGTAVELVVSVADPVKNVLADRAGLEQVILNLVANARDAMPAGGKLLFQTANRTPSAEEAIRTLDLEPGEYVCLSVVDSGEGMSEETQQRLFEPFFTTKEEGQGTGLGLAIVYGIVRGLGGSVKVQSELGSGARFDIYLPATEERVSEEPECAPTPIGEVSGESILVVEDNAGVRELACTILENSGYEVSSASDPMRALAMARNLDMPPDLLLTDVVMPGMSGRDLADKLRDIHPRLNVLYMSGYTNSVLSERSNLPEGMHFIQKPFSIEALLAQVRAALEDNRPGH
jgi:two-component system, cell cycle sensor histidine kinase and response regulator CckA